MKIEVPVEKTYPQSQYLLLRIDKNTQMPKPYAPVMVLSVFDAIAFCSLLISVIMFISLSFRDGALLLFGSLFLFLFGRIARLLNYRVWLQERELFMNAKKADAILPDEEDA